MISSCCKKTIKIHKIGVKPPAFNGCQAGAHPSAAAAFPATTNFGTSTKFGPSDFGSSGHGSSSLLLRCPKGHHGWSGANMQTTRKSFCLGASGLESSSE